MKRVTAGIMAMLTLLLGLVGCGKTQPVPTVPEKPSMPGTLVGVNYSTGGGMAHRTEFSIRLTKDEIEHTAYWPEDLDKTEMEERSHVPITAQQWADVETVLLQLYGEGLLEEHRPATEKVSSDAFVLDGGDYTDLSLVWETDEGTEEISYYWPGDRRVLTLMDLLKELAEPIGREIVWYDPPQLDEIYFTRDHRVNTERDYSFQLHWADYEAEPYWELTYYLGKHGEVDQGHLRLEEADWEAFVAFAEEIQLEYFPTPTKDDPLFICRVYYTDGSYKNLNINKETEQQLKQFFFNWIEQK